jgi:hypothetical protein
MFKSTFSSSFLFRCLRYNGLHSIILTCKVKWMQRRLKWEYKRLAGLHADR